jgi:hypothetical protein
MRSSLPRPGGAASSVKLSANECMKQQGTASWFSNAVKHVLGFFLLLVFIPIVIPWAVLWLFYGLFLYIALWLTWCTRGHNVLLVYSNSPNWQEYVEQRILPRLPSSTLVLNWSDRKKWSQLWLSVRAFHYFCGDVECNPLAVVFTPSAGLRPFDFGNHLETTNMVRLNLLRR